MKGEKNMKQIWNTIQLAFAAVGGFVGWFLGGCDGLLYTLLAFVVIDYITGVMCRFGQKAVVRDRLQGHLPEGAHFCAGRHRAHS